MSENFNSMETVSFRRFLSYIYAYEDERKLRNVGFAKVEIRAPRVRFQVIVNGLMQKGGRPMEICLVDESMRRIPVGQMVLQNGRGEYQGSTALETMWESGLSFSQVYGICLQPVGNRRHYYMTLWREPKPFFRAAEAETGEKEDAEEIQGALKWQLKDEAGKCKGEERVSSGELNLQAEVESREEIGKEVHGEVRLKSEPEVESREKLGEEVHGEVRSKSEPEVKSREKLGEEVHGEVRSKSEPEVESCEKLGKEVHGEVRSKSEPEVESREKLGEEVHGEVRLKSELEICMKTSEEVLRKSGLEEKREKEDLEEKRDKEDAEEVQKERRAKSEQECCMKTSEEIQQEIEAASELLRQQEAIADAIPQNAQRYVRRSRRGTGKVENQMELWKKFCSHYPHVDIRPISLMNRGAEAGLEEKGKLCEVIRIRPNDIGRLPRNNWILAHNSFLQNSYNHFRYLILFRVEYQKETGEHTSRWFLGLPGEKNEQEAMVAKVFGFQKYLSCRHGGFWYTEIFMGAY